MKTLFINSLRTVSSYQIKSYITAYGLVLLMTAAAFSFKEKEIILPELAALSIGCFLYKKNELTDNPLHLSLLPVLTAFMGFFINQFDINIALKIVLVLMVMFALLHFFKSSLAPVLATGLLPIITHCDSYIFLISIIFFMGLLGFLTVMFFKPGKLVLIKSNKTEPMRPKIVFLAVLILWIFICYTAGIMQMAAIPPVIVVGYECIHKKQYSLKLMCGQVIALASAAFIGAQVIYYLDNFLLAVVINFIVAATILHFLRIKMAPIYAVVMLPIILPGSSHVYFGVSTAAASAVILGSVYILVNKTSLKL
ncbi:hypothetical protein J2Y38_003894 [Flavobacterium sp. 2755]|uniref:hypothetical protein n=1 Tax=Flavobacterium sp. 2755 TaxID=2817765 RepID=UPI00285AC8AA|nr:hypothetical protein [Flavobacterium sp. 2755]MDR6763670.1 hypothetical protein [Flavobacterium sp. 2755]